MDDAERAEHARASEELERACDFAAAAHEALLASDPRRAAVLAALAGAASLCAEAVERVATSLGRDEGLRTAADLARRGFGRPAGELFARLEAFVEAGEAFASSGEVRRAATNFERANRPADAARVLENALRAHPENGEARLELGRLLLRHGRIEAGVKALQRLEREAPERPASLPLLRDGLARLGLDDAARAIEIEMKALGVEAEPAPPSSVPVKEARPVLYGRFETVREVAETPHARVVEAIDRTTGERVAVKLLAPFMEGGGRDALVRFEREARALAELRHTNVVPLRAYYPEGPAMVLAWMSGGSLAQRLAAEPMAPARAVEVASAVLAALGEAHRLGILHRDVKPSNVLFDDAGTTRLADFGAAHLGDLSSTATAGAIGTFAYMSPEQRLGRPANIASDLYGVGALLSEMLVGVPLGPSTSDTLEPRPSAYHDELTREHDAILARLLQEDPKRRPADAFDARRLLHSVEWPVRIEERRARLTDPPRTSERPPTSETSRLVASALGGDPRDGATRFHDKWLARDVLVLPLDADRLDVARAFATSGHPALPAILRVDTAANTLWVAAPRGRALADQPRELDEAQRAHLRAAVGELHARSAGHGSLDAEHLYVHDGELEIAFPRTDGPAKSRISLDLRALAELDPQP